MGPSANMFFVLLSFFFFFSLATACAGGKCRLLDKCSTDDDCGAELYCFSCPQGFSGSRCVRSSITDQFKVLNNSLPFNKYAFLTTHNSYAIDGEPSHTGVRRLTFTNQEDSVSQQLKNGARALMLDTYDFEGGVWLCHSFGGECHDYTAFGPAIDTLREIETFLSVNPVEIVTVILEDYVKAPNGLTKVFTEAGLMKYWFPVTSMPRNGEDWPLVSDMVAKNQRLIVFTSIKSKQETEGIAYQWNYMVENQYGDGGMHRGSCPARAESAPLNDRTKSLVLVNYFKTIPLKQPTCEQNSGDLIKMLHTCYGAAGNRWANFVAVDYYKRSEGGGSFQAIDTMNAKLLCGCDDIHACVENLCVNMSGLSTGATSYGSSINYEQYNINNDKKHKRTTYRNSSIKLTSMGLCPNIRGFTTFNLITVGHIRDKVPFSPTTFSPNFVTMNSGIRSPRPIECHLRRTTHKKMSATSRTDDCSMQYIFTQENETLLY